MSQILIERQGGIAIVTLNRPEKRNALSPEMLVRLAQFWKDIADDHSVRVVVLTGAGDQAFSSGGDMGSLIPLMMKTRAPVGEWEERFAADRKQLGAALLRNASFFKPVIAAINGHAHAGGAEFVMSTDLRVMSSEATLAVTEVRRGLIASGGSLVRMARQVPWAHAMELLLLGEPVSAQQALAMGLVNAVVPADQLDAEVRKWCEEILEKSPTAIALAKKSFNVDTEMIRGMGGLAMHALKMYYETPESAEGGNAFREKRKPEFRKHVK
jgi:enoyl-CoA hydratase/carnithine racemase